ncbi:MAG: restriction endonuclease subunit S [Lentisphaerae bacterium]|nr:restriction endonuclease subunit S [Lentisphaerota bacterium]
MKSEWKTVFLADVIKIISGGTPKTSIKEYWNGDIPWLSIADFNTKYRWVSYADKSITERGLIESSTALLNEGDVIISARGTVGALAQLSVPMAFNQSCYGIREKPEITCIDYIYYCLHKTIAEMKQKAHGGVFSTITRNTFKIIEISLPPLAEQRAIAHILGTLDDKIELNRKQNETLEEMARALFKAWFIDFEPVRAKIEGRWKRGQSLPGLPTHLYDLFPSRLVESELGEIPEGWEVDRVGSHFNLTMGQSPPGDTYNDIGDGLPFFQGRTDFGFRYPKNRIYCTAPTRIANMEDTLVSVRAPVGDINLAWERCCIGRGVAAIRHNFGARSFTYHAMRSLQPEINQYEHTGTVFGSINRKQFQELIFIAPPENLVPAFESIAGIFDDKVRNNLAQSRTLAELRDTLLPKLISGELRVKDAERFVSGKM